MSSLVVVAIPADDDQVWKVSSEKVPHLTLLYLGDSNTVDNVDSIAEFLDHAASTSLNRFGLDVDRRGVLGGDQADVLFFSAGWEAKEVKQFRHYLLQNDDIRTAYDSSEQHPDWLPHLTLGYPETPAKPNPNDYGIGWVRFDRIALWLGDYEGPEFVLQRSNDYAEVSMSDAVENVLAHYGKKGMKWGVRNAPARKEHSSDSAEARKAHGKAKAKGSTSLSNSELKLLNERLQLEKKYSDLNPDTTAKGKNFVKKQLINVTGMTVAAVVSKKLLNRI